MQGKTKMVWPRVKAGRGGYHQEDDKQVQGKTKMVWPRVKAGRGRYHQEDVKQVQGKRRRGRPKKRWLDNISDDMKEYK